MMATQPNDSAIETKDVPQGKSQASIPGAKETAAKTTEALETGAEATTAGAQEGARQLASWPGYAWGQIGRLVEGLFSQDFPPVDIIDRDGELQVYAELPRVRKEDLNVTVSDNTVTIKGTMREVPQEGTYVRQELRRGPFARTLELPVEIDPPKGKAKFKDYRLELTLTKSSRGVTLKIE